MPVTSSCSWNWRKLLQMRDLARQFVIRRNDEEVWRMARSRFSIVGTWQEIRPKKEKVAWQKLLWSSLVIPKHSVITWMAILNKLPTKDRLISWGIEVNGVCYLCQMDQETRDHIFFGCCFSRSIWDRILSLCEQSRQIGNWNEELQWAIKQIKGRKLVSAILRIAWRGCIYHVWRERNRRLYGNATETYQKAFEQIKEAVRIKLAGMKFSATAANGRLCNGWGLHDAC